MISRPNPLHLDVLRDISAPLAPQIQELVARIKTVERDQAGWANRQLALTRLRFGKRRKKKIPWEGANNINVPLTDGIMRRWRPAITGLILNAQPVAFFTANEQNDLPDSRTAEAFFTWLFVNYMKTAPEVAKLVDLIAARGHAYSREGWKYETSTEVRVAQVEQIIPEGVENFVREAIKASAGQITPEVAIAQRLATEYAMSLDDPEESGQLLEAAVRILSGAPFVRLRRAITECDRPAWTAIDPLYTIAEQVSDPSQGDFFVVIHELSAEDILRRGQDGVFDPAKAKQLAEKLATPHAARYDGTGAGYARRQLEDFMDRRAGAATMPSSGRTPRACVWECFCRLDLVGNGVKERCILWHAPDQGITLSTTEYPFPFKRWPVTLFKFEPHADRPIDSRGIPELLAELHKLVNALHNARLDASQIILSPVLQKESLADDYARTVQWRPGSIIPVRNVGGIAPIPQDFRILAGLLQEEQVTQRTAEAFIGTFDATITNLEAGRERRTAAEVNAITQLAGNVYGLDAQMFQVSMGESFAKIWKLWVEFGPPKIFFRVLGEEQPRQAVKAELDFEYDITPAGTPASTNKQFLIASMQQILQIVIADQTGRFDVGALLQEYFKLIDYKVARLITRSPEQTAAAQIVMQAARAESEAQGGPPPEALVI